MTANAAAAEDVMEDAAAVEVAEMTDALMIEEETTDEEVMTTGLSVVATENEVTEVTEMSVVTEEIENQPVLKEVLIGVPEDKGILVIQETVHFLEKEDVEASFLLFFLKKCSFGIIFTTQCITCHRL